MADFFCSAVLCCALLCCTLLYCAVLCCPVLCVLSGRKTAFSRPEIPISRQEKKRRAARKDLSGQIAVFPVSDRTNSHLTGRRILFPLRQTHRSVCHAEGKSPLTHSADTGKIDLKRSSGTEILLRPVDKVRFHNADTAARASEKKRSLSTAEKKRMQRFHIASSFLCVIRASVRRR